MTTDIDIGFVAVHPMQLPPLHSSITEGTGFGEIPQLPCHHVRSYSWISGQEKDPLLLAVQPKLQHPCRVTGFSLTFDSGCRSSIMEFSL